MKLVSWNVNGIRAIAQKGFFENVKKLDADIICLQETKAQDDQVAETLAGLNDYKLYSNSAERKGYSGTAILSRIPLLDVKNDIGIEEHDQEGRLITVEHDLFYLVNVYVPNSGSELARLDYRSTWDKDLLNYLRKLDDKKPVILCGDLNVAHQEIDIARPKSNYNVSAGYTQVEIDGMTNHLNNGFIDTFRYFYPDTVKYSWWSYRAGARDKNIGWRLDYFLASRKLEKSLSGAEIHNDYFGSDHCPVSLELN